MHVEDLRRLSHSSREADADWSRVTRQQQVPSGHGRTTTPEEFDSLMAGLEAMVSQFTAKTPWFTPAMETTRRWVRSVTGWMSGGSAASD